MGKLVLSRKVGESIVICDPTNKSSVIIITQGKVAGNKFSIAIEAPRHLQISRAELVEKQGAK